MRRTTMSIPAATLGAIVTLLLVPALALAQPCAQVFERLYPERDNQTVRYVRGEQGNDITYGLEAEIPIDKAPKLLDWYRPANKTDEQWLAMSLEQRQAAVPFRGGGLVKTRLAPEWAQNQLSSDPGGAELISKPVGSLEQALSMIRQVETLLGPGAHGNSKAYWQANVAYKRDGAFSRQNRDGIMGYVKATADYAQFGKLHKGWEIYQRNPSYEPGKNLGHGVLGPMNTQKVAETEQELAAAVEGRSTNRHTHYMQGTYFRTWAYGPNRAGFEARDPHKDLGVLKRELRRLTHGLERGFDRYKSFKSISMLNEAGDFGKFSQQVQQMLQRADLSYAKRYALAMRPFEAEYPQALGLQGPAAERFRTNVVSARNQYVQTLERLATDYQNVDSKQLRTQVRVALSKFTHQSGIYTALDNHFAQIGHGPNR